MRQALEFEAIDEYSQSVINPLEFTRNSEEKFYNVVDLADFQDDDAEKIFRCLKDELRLIPFGDYLKRYIFIKSEMKGDFRAIPLDEYIQVVTFAFHENNTPKSFKETSASLKTYAKNWLTQGSVNRSIIFLLGFGLKMSVDDVSGFLLYAQQERDFNFKDPTEIIYWYCFKNGYNYTKASRLMEQYAILPMRSGSAAVYENGTISLRDTFLAVQDDQTLLNYLENFKGDMPMPLYSITAYKWFTDLYCQCKAVIAGYYNNDERELAKESGRKSLLKTWTTDEITESDLEKFLCSGIPTDKNGNLIKATASNLAKSFSGKRMSRQHTRSVLQKTAPVDRFDLITLYFFLTSQDERHTTNKMRYTAFVDGVNMILNECSMGELYVANPYECFVLMCILSDGPLATYADVWEKSFEE